MDWIKIGLNCIGTAIKALKELKEVKALNSEINIQTSADLVSNQAIIKYLTENKVKCNLFSEEEEKVMKINGGDPKVILILDPLDNSHLFLRGEISFCSVALIVLIDGFPEYAFIGDISTLDIYYCDKNKAYKNGISIKVPGKVEGRNIILGWAPYKLRLERLYQLINLTEKKYYLYNFGGQLQAVKILTGNYDAYIEVRAETFNEFGAAIIVERAGGYVSTLKGEKVTFNPKMKQTLLIARTKEIKEDILNILKDKDYEN